MYHYSPLERDVARLVWEMNRQGIEVTEHSLAQFASRCKPPIRGKLFHKILETLHQQNLIVLSWKTGVGPYVRYVSPKITEIFGTKPHRLPTSSLPEVPIEPGSSGETGKSEEPEETDR